MTRPRFSVLTSRKRLNSHFVEKQRKRRKKIYLNLVNRTFLFYYSSFISFCTELSNYTTWYAARSYHLALAMQPTRFSCKARDIQPPLLMKFSDLEWAHRSRRSCALVRQCRLGFLAGRTHTIHANVRNTIADDNRLSAARCLDVKVLELDVLTHGVGVAAACQPRDGITVLAGRVTGKVLKEDVGDVHLRGVLGACCLVNVEVARVDEGSVLVVTTPEVAEGDVVDETVTNIRAGPGLETGSVLAVEHPDILDDDILDKGLFALVLTKRSNGLSMSSWTLLVPIK